MEITKEELRQVIREEIERALLALLDAKTTATAIEHGLLYTADPTLSQGKPSFTYFGKG